MTNVEHSARYVVVGGTGFVGSGIVAELHARGHKVTALPAPRLRSSAATAQGLLNEARAEPALTSLVPAFAGVDIVINAAGLAAPGDPGSASLTGANALLPAVIVLAARDAGVARVIHVSSASVQGHRSVIDESAERAPFSPYSRSKALAEDVLELLARDITHANKTGVITVRATSVQGPGRATTLSLAKIARSPLASVAAPGTAATPVSSLAALAWFVVEVAQHRGKVPDVVLQPWEGLSVREVLLKAGGRRPLVLPRWLCRTALALGYFVSRRLLGERLHGSLRRVELMWCGQAQLPGWAESAGLLPAPAVGEVLDQARRGARTSATS